MSRFFDAQTPFMQKISKICDVVILGLVFFISCMPVLTIGAALTALYYTTVKVLRRGRGYVLQEYMRAFKLNFKNATVTWLVFLVLIVLAIFNIYFSVNWLSKDAGILFAGGYLAVFFFILSIILYMYPILSRFVVGKGQLFKMSYLMALRHFPFTVLFVLVTVFAFVAGWYFLFRFPFAILLLPAGSKWLISIFMEKILYRYIPEEEKSKQQEGSSDEERIMEDEGAEGERDKKAWYLEK